MLYIVCPTCNYFIGQKTITYEEGKEKICNNPELTSTEKENEISKLLLSLKLRRYCCRMRVMTYKDIVKDILPVSNN
jgi:DNA-directed RNA polymerase subunit N (RpoN/RPB10)|uniref:DNA-directed RNA polymerase subunit N n=1 Tax=viral metagenome TaxID=1070528 RepID=A0A6C0EET0_9ZZZZ